MTLRVKTVLALILVGAIIVFFLRPNNAQPRAILLFEGYRIGTNQTKKASFTLTNPAPVAVDYTAIKESGRSNSFVIDGTLRNGHVISLQVPVSQTPARLFVHCRRQGRLREHLADVRNMIGLRPATQSAEYTLISEPFRE